jgi:hypothetical protein
MTWEGDNECESPESYTPFAHRFAKRSYNEESTNEIMLRHRN